MPRIHDAINARRRSRRLRVRCSLVGAIGALMSLLMVQPIAGVNLADRVSGELSLPGLALALPSLAVATPPLPTLPPLPVPTPTLPPLPTVPVPTLPPLPTPTLPVPTLPVPTLPVPTMPVPTLPVPTLPVPTLPVPTLPGQTPTLGPGVSPGTPGSTPSDPAGPFTGILLAAADATPPPQDGAAGEMTDSAIPVVEGRSPLDFVVPGLIVGVPIAVVIFVLLQAAGAAAWLPVVRRWLGRRL